MRSHQIALNITHTDLPAAGFQINRRSGRHLNLKIHIAQVATVAVVSHDVDDQTCLGLPGVEMDCGGFHGRGDSNLIARPRFDRNRPGEILQLDPDVLSGWIMPRYSLLGERAGGYNEYEEEGRKCCKTCSVYGDGRMKVHRWIMKPGSGSACFSLRVRQIPSAILPCRLEQH